MAQREINLRVVTPERQLLATDTDAVVIPAHDGEIGILPGRAPLMCELGIGQLRYDEDGKAQRIFIDGGFAQIHDNQVIVLSPHAMKPDEITAETVSAAEAASTDHDLRDPEERLRRVRRASALRRMRA
jgi:F-type H+-transporting ATPase subunit epsilon